VKGQATVLGQIENTIGRDPGCDVWIDADGVSRRHARIRVEGQAANLEDLGSTNGTFLNGTAVNRPARLKDGDRIRLGKTTVTFRAAGAADAPTKRVKPSSSRTRA
jgi:pSer/pThr/pTyr-binding forkhead associated (FHA) protein